MIFIYALMVMIVIVICLMDFSKFFLDDNTKNLLYCDDDYQEKDNKTVDIVKDNKNTVAEFSANQNISESDIQSAKDAEELLQRIYGDNK